MNMVPIVLRENMTNPFTAKFKFNGLEVSPHMARYKS